MSELARTPLLRWVTAGLLAALFVMPAIVFVSQSQAVASIKRSSPHFQLARLNTPAGRARAERPDRDTLRAALVAAPLDSSVVSAATFNSAASRSSGQPAANELALLERLGWRSTVALQNIVFSAVQRRDLRAIADVADALLRRRDVEQEAYTLMRLMELAPETRKMLVAKLMADPVWRYPYFRLGGLEGQQQAMSRAQLITDLSKVGSPLNRGELYSSLNMLVAAGQAPVAHSLWLDYRKVKQQPLSDGEFEWAYRMRAESESGMPFEWVLPSGSGYWSEVIQKEDGKAAVAINWDAKGVPLLLAQQTVLTPKAYRLIVTGSDIQRDVFKILSFSLRCPDGRTVFDQIVSQSSNRIVATSPESVRCNSPVFEVTGRVGDSLFAQAQGQSGISPSYNFVLDSIALN